VFAWALLLPMAIPAYVLAFVAVAGLDFSGPVQTWLRGVFGSDLRLPPIRSTGGVILVMSLALYPYVYLLARGAFATQGRRALEVAASLGLTPRQALLRVQLPMARPWIAGGAALVAMETLADFGTVAVFNYDTFTTAIWRAWSALYSIEAALQLAGLLVLLVTVALVFEQRARAAQRHTARWRTARRQLPRRQQAAGATAPRARPRQAGGNTTRGRSTRGAGRRLRRSGRRLHAARLARRTGRVRRVLYAKPWGTSRRTSPATQGRRSTSSTCLRRTGRRRSTSTRSSRRASASSGPTRTPCTRKACGSTTRTAASC
jgi:ABC-type molybdate transport system permease subunit